MSKYKPFSKDVQQEVWNKTDGRCWYCGEKTSQSLTGINGESIKMKFTVDHFVSLSYGGTDEISNLVPACWSCNTSKQKRSLEEWKDSLRWKDIGRFTEKQIAWLKSNGIDIPEPQEIKFYFEIMGLGLEI